MITHFSKDCQRVVQWFHAQPPQQRTQSSRTKYVPIGTACALRLTWHRLRYTLVTYGHRFYLFRLATANSLFNRLIWIIREQLVRNCQLAFDWF